MTFISKIRGLQEVWQFDNRWHLILMRIFFPGQNMLLYRFKGAEFLTDHRAGDANGAREVLTGPMYRRYFALMNLPREINVLDLGANNGGFPLLLKTEGFEVKTLACVELNPKTFTRLQFNLDLNFNGQFKALNCGICGANRNLTVNLGSGSVSDNIYSAESSDETESLSIQGRTFDDVYAEFFGDKNIDLCKIDIEGAEFEMFESGTAQNISKCKYVLMEIHHSAATPRESVFIKMREAGFEEVHCEQKTREDNVHFFVNRNG